MENTSQETAHYLTVAELRQRWKVSAMFIWRLRRDGKLKVTKFGPRGVRVAISEIERIERESQEPQSTI
jgi:predicted site-specific integrase-resolvase